MRLLVVEDESLIAQDIAWVVESIQGCTVVGIAGSVEEGLAFVKSAQIDGAILDANLEDESSRVVAEELRRRNIPYFVLSGCLDQDMLPSPLNRAPLLEKPYCDRDLIAQIANLASAAAAAE
jgi:DNA-binding NarL/FixJ family response regulator